MASWQSLTFSSGGSELGADGGCWAPLLAAAKSTGVDSATIVAQLLQVRPVQHTCVRLYTRRG
jgi:hypothetical protein